MEIIPNPDQVQEKPVVDLTKDSDNESETDGPTSPKKSKDDNPVSKPSTSQTSQGTEAADCEDKKPNIDELRKKIRQSKIYKEQGVQTEGPTETAEDKSYKERLKTFQKNVHELLHMFDPSKDWGGPEKIEEVIVLMMQHVDPSDEDGD